MPLVPVTTYAAAWNPTTNKGRMFIQIGTAQASPVPVEDADEFMILLVLLGFILLINLSIRHRTGPISSGSVCGDVGSVIT